MITAPRARRAILLKSASDWCKSMSISVVLCKRRPSLENVGHNIQLRVVAAIRRSAAAGRCV